MSEEPKIHRTAEDYAWTALVSNCHRWASNHMDQWEKFSFDTRYGKIYVTISRQDPYPGDFGVVDMIGRPIVPNQGAESAKPKSDNTPSA